MNQFVCDSCGKATKLRPKVEYLYDEAGKPRLKKIIQNGQEIMVPEYRDLEERAWIVRLSCGDEVVQRDFCKECLDKILPTIKALWDVLNGYEPC